PDDVGEIGGRTEHAVLFEGAGSRNRGAEARHRYRCRRCLRAPGDRVTEDHEELKTRLPANPNPTNPRDPRDPWARQGPPLLTSFTSNSFGHHFPVMNSRSRAASWAMPFRTSACARSPSESRPFMST